MQLQTNYILYLYFTLFALAIKAHNVTESATNKSDKDVSVEYSYYDQDSKSADRSSPDQKMTFKQSGEEVDIDGRSVAFVNNHYIVEEPEPISASSAPLAESLSDTTPPLYQLLQQQMEQVLASTAPDLSVYASSIPGNEQALPDKPSFSYSEENADNNDYEYSSETDSDTELNQQHKVNAFKYDLTPFVTKQPKSDTKNYRKQSSGDGRRPTDNSSDSFHKHRRHITFKTVSTSSHYVSTPLAELMFKFSIGVAKPETNAEYNSKKPPSSSPVQPNLSAYTNALHKQTKHRSLLTEHAQAAPNKLLYANTGKK